MLSPTGRAGVPHPLTHPSARTRAQRRLIQDTGLAFRSFPMLDHLTPFPRRSVALALYRMLTGDRFDVCVLRQALDVAGVDYPRSAFEALRLHHCARFGDLPPGFHAEIASQTLALVAGRPVLGEPAPAQAGSFFKDLAAAAGLDPATAPLLPALAAAQA